MSKQSIFQKRIIHKALSQVFSDNAAFVSQHIDEVKADSDKGYYKNVCVKLPKPVTERLESTLDFLNMSKGEFFMMAIIDALDKAEVIFGELDLAEHFDDQAKMLSDHGISVTTEKEGA